MNCARFLVRLPNVSNFFREIENLFFFIGFELNFISIMNVNLLRVLFAILCLVGSVGYGQAMIYAVGKFLRLPNTLLWLGVGAALYIVLYLFYFARQEKFWSVFEHELTHALFAILFFRKVHAFEVKRGAGGSVKIDSNNFVVGLSPYFFPLLAVPIVLVKPSFGFQHQAMLNGLLGYTLMFHLVHLVKEFHPQQPDIKKHGMLFSIVVLLFFNLFFIGLAIASLGGNWGDMRDFLYLGYYESMLFVKKTWQIFYQQSFGKYT